MFCDVLTGLPDAVFFVDRLQQCLAQAARRRQQVALVYLDIDGFRHIVETNGVAGGDAVLRELADRLKRCTLRQEDTTARLCGDQFVMVLGDTDAHGLRDVLDKIVAAARCKFHVGATDVSVSVSIGASLSPRDGKEWSPMLRHASMLMRQAKRAGGDRYIFDGDLDVADDRLPVRQAPSPIPGAVQRTGWSRHGDGARTGVRAGIR